MKLRANVRPQWQWAKLKQLLAIVLMFWGTISMYGQSKMISGIVQSESDGEPLVGATVIVKETKAGGTTDLNGRYSVQAGQGQTLIVSLHRLPFQRNKGRKKQPYRRAITRGQRNVGRSSSCRLRYDETQ